MTELTKHIATHSQFWKCLTDVFGWAVWGADTQRSTQPVFPAWKCTPPHSLFSFSPICWERHYKDSTELNTIYPRCRYSECAGRHYSGAMYFGDGTEQAVMLWSVRLSHRPSKTLAVWGEEYQAFQMSIGQLPMQPSTTTLLRNLCIRASLSLKLLSPYCIIINLCSTLQT